MTQPSLLLGKRPTGITLAPVNAPDEFSETMLYSVSAKNETEFIRLWPIGATLAGAVKALRTTKAANPKDQSDYVCLEVIGDGGEITKVRAYTPGQLRHNLDKAVEANGIGVYVEMTYKGKEYVEALQADVHQFDVVAGKMQ